MRINQVITLDVFDSKGVYFLTMYNNAWIIQPVRPAITTRLLEYKIMFSKLKSHWIVGK